MPSQTPLAFACQFFTNHTCRSCDLLDLSYEKSLILKREGLLQLFPPHLLKDFIPSDKFFASRNKAKMAVTGSLENPIIGLIDREFRGKELLSCPLHLPMINEILQEIKVLIPQFKILPYDIPARRGECKFILLHQSDSTQEIMLRFVLRSREAIQRIEKMKTILMEKFPVIKVFSVNIQPIHQAILEGPEEILLTEEKHIFHQMGPYRLAISPKSFFQTNYHVALQLYSYVGELIQTLKPDFLLDLFCGIGAFSFFASPYAKKILGIEISQEAIDCAQLSVSSSSRDLSNLQFQCADVTKFLQDPLPSPDVIILNPPRGGLNDLTLQWIVNKKPQTVIYSSCNPKTLKRDVAVLLDSSYELISLKPFDMFPMTKHIEVVAILQYRPEK